MAGISATGQITLVDNNDARPITAFVSASNGVQQIYTLDSTTAAYQPNWDTAAGGTANALTAVIYVGASSGSIDVIAAQPAQVTNMRWSNDLTNYFGLNSATFSINTNANLSQAAPQKTYYFEADYADPMTGLISHIIAQIGLSQIKTGTNAVFVQMTGIDKIKKSNGTAANKAVLTAILMRAAGEDVTLAALPYRWFKTVAGVESQINSTHADIANIAFKTAANGASSAPVGAAYSLGKTIEISEGAVADIAYFRVEVKDGDNALYSTTFVVHDVSDPYTVSIFSTAGEKFQNGVGSTNLSPIVYNGAAQVPSLTGWTFSWSCYNKDGLRAAFVDTSKAVGGRAVPTHAAGSSIPYSGAAFAVTQGDIVKCVNAAGATKYFEVGTTGSASPIALRAPTTNTWLSNGSTVTLDEFKGGMIFPCLATRSSAATAAITVTGTDIDIKGTIICEATKPI